MKMHIWALCGSFGLLCLIFAMLAFGGAGQAQPGVATQAREESPLAQTYIVLDRHLSTMLPAVGKLSRGLARTCFADAYPAIKADPDVGLHLLFSESRGFMAGLARLAYWGAPILLLASLLLYFLRPKTIHLIKS
ncbi:MAG: hypothetical protein WCD66_14080 [Rhodanobacteraceae bacterium]